MDAMIVGEFSSAITSATAPSARSRVRLQPVMLLAVLGLALFCSATWTARADASGVATPVVYTTRFVSFGTYMLVAWLFRNHLPSVDHLMEIAVSFMGVHLVAVIGGPSLALGESAALAVDYVSGVFEGVANALIVLLYAHILSSYAPRRSSMAVALAYLGVDALILFLDLLDAQVLHHMRSAFIVASVAILAWCVRAMLGVRPGSTPADHALQYGMARDGGEDDRPLAFLSRHTDWLLLLIVAILFPNLFGVIAQVSSETGGNFALYDVTTEIVMVAAQAAFLVFMASYGHRYGFATILAFVVPLYATGFALFPGNWAAGIPFAGCFIRAGYVVLTVLIWALMARKSYEDPRHTYLYFAIYCGVSNAQLGRLVGTLLMGDVGPNLPLCQNISLGALWAICIFGLVIFFLLRRTAPGAADDGFATMAGDEGAAAFMQAPIETNGPALAEAEAGCAAERVAKQATEKAADSSAGENSSIGPSMPQAPSSSDRPQATFGSSAVVDSFSAQLEALAERVGLAPREREVIIEAVHGYSRTNIAKKLYLSPETVKTYLNRAYAKAGVSSKQEFIALVEREGMSL